MGMQKDRNDHEVDVLRGLPSSQRKSPVIARSSVKAWMRPGVRTFALVLGMCAFVSTARPTAQPGQNPSMDPNKPYLLPQANRIPDANAQMEMRSQKLTEKNFAAINLERKKQIADDSARLLKLATDLKMEVDKTTKDTLSVAVIRKADEIERLAHAVREKMKASVGN